MDIREWQQRILANQFLTLPDEKLTVIAGTNGLQAQFLSSARHALAIRCREPLETDWGAGLVKSWTVRGTMHIFPERDLPLFLHRGRSHFLRDVDQFVDDSYVCRERKEFFAAHILSCIDSGITDREALRQACRDEGMTATEEESLFNSWGGLLRAMAEAGMICYQVREEKHFRRCPPFAPMEKEAAQLEQARRYFTHFGPATVRDAAYYFGTTQKQVKQWLQKLPVTAEICAGKECFRIEEATGDLPEIPECILLAGFDQLMLGYEKKESIFLPPEYLRGIFNLSGIVHPGILLDGEIAGRWKVAGKKGFIAAFRPLTSREKENISQEMNHFSPSVKEILFTE